MKPKNRKDQIRKLLQGIETGDPSSVAVVNPNKYIQHNPQTEEGGEGLAALFKRLSKSNPRVNIVRIFSDGDYVFGHTEYEFDTSRVGFEIFRFEGDLAVEHWDNIQRRKPLNASGHTMVDGPTMVQDLEKTQLNREVVQAFIKNVLIDGQLNRVGEYIDKNNFTEHSPVASDNLDSHPVLSNASDRLAIKYEKHHRVLADGNFVLSVSEGRVEATHTSFFDLFRLAKGKIVEHWDTREHVPPVAEWKNNNGKFLGLNES